MKTDGSVPEWLEDGNVSVYVIPKVRRSFAEGLKSLIKNHTGRYADPITLDRPMSRWVADMLRAGRAAADGDEALASCLEQAVLALTAAKRQAADGEEVASELEELCDQVASVRERQLED